MSKTQYKQVVSMMTKTLPKNNPMINALLGTINDIAEGKDMSQTILKAKSIVEKSLNSDELNMVFNGLSTDNEQFKKENEFLKEQTNKYQTKYIEEKEKVKNKDKEISKLKAQIEIYQRIIELEL